MAKVYSRQQRVADLIQQELARLILRELTELKPALVTVSAVKVSKDYHYAKVYVTVLADQKSQVTAAIDVLNNAAPYLRSLLAKTLNMRTTPELRFVYDESVQYGVKLAALIDKVVTDEPKAKK